MIQNVVRIKKAFESDIDAFIIRQQNGTNNTSYLIIQRSAQLILACLHTYNQQYNCFKLDTFTIDIIIFHIPFHQ